MGFPSIPPSRGPAPLAAVAGDVARASPSAVRTMVAPQPAHVGLGSSTTTPGEVERRDLAQLQGRDRAALETEPDRPREFELSKSVQQREQAFAADHLPN